MVLNELQLRATHFHPCAFNPSSANGIHVIWLLRKRNLAQCDNRRDIYYMDGRFQTTFIRCKYMYNCVLLYSVYKNASSIGKM